MAFSRTNNQYFPINFDNSTQYNICESVWAHSINPYFELYTHYKYLEKGDDTEVNVIGVIINPKGIGTVVLGLEDYTGKLHNIFFKRLPPSCSSQAPHQPPKWSQDRVEYKVRREGTYLKVIRKQLFPCL